MQGWVAMETTVKRCGTASPVLIDLSFSSQAAPDSRDTGARVQQIQLLTPTSSSTSSTIHYSSSILFYQYGQYQNFESN